MRFWRLGVEVGWELPLGCTSYSPHWPESAPIDGSTHRGISGLATIDNSIRWTCKHDTDFCHSKIEKGWLGGAGRSSIQKTRSHAAETNSCSSDQHAYHGPPQTCTTGRESTCWWCRLCCQKERGKETESEEEQTNLDHAVLGVWAFENSVLISHLSSLATWQFSVLQGAGIERPSHRRICSRELTTCLYT